MGYVIGRFLLVLIIANVCGEQAEASFIKGWINNVKDKAKARKEAKRRETAPVIFVEREDEPQHRTSAMYIDPPDMFQGDMPDDLTVPASWARVNWEAQQIPAPTVIPEVVTRPEPTMILLPPTQPARESVPALAPAAVILLPPAAPEPVKERPYGIPELHCWPWLSLDDRIALMYYKENTQNGRRLAALSPLSAEALLEGYLFSLMPTFSTRPDLPPGVPLSQIIGRNVKQVLAEHFRVSLPVRMTESTVYAIADRAAQNQLVATCARDVLARSSEPYGTFTAFDTDLIVPGPAIPDYCGTWYSDDPAIYLRKKHYKFVDVKVADGVGSQFDVAIKLSKRVSLDQPDAWQELTFNFPLNISEIRNTPHKISLNPGGYELMLRHTHHARWGQHSANAVIKDRGSLEEYLRLSLRIPAIGHNDVGYLCQYHPKFLNLLLLPRKLEPLLPFAQKDLLKGNSIDSLSTLFSSIGDEYMSILKAHGFESAEWHRFTDTLLHYPEFIKGRKDTIPIAESDKFYTRAPIITSFMVKFGQAQAIFEQLMTASLYDGFNYLYRIGRLNYRDWAYSFKHKLSDYVSRVVNIRNASMQLAAPTDQWPRQMLQWCGLNVSENITPQEAASAWKTHFVCDLEDALGLAALIHVSSGKAVPVFETGDKCQQRHAHAEAKDILKALYRQIQPLVPTFKIDMDVTEDYVEMVVKRITGPKGKPLGVVRKEIEDDVQAIQGLENRFKALVYAPSDEIIQNYLYKPNETRGSALETALEQLEKEIKDRLAPQLRGRPVEQTFISQVKQCWSSKDPFETAYRAACIQWIYDNPEGLTEISEGIRAFEAMLLAKHADFMKLGYFTDRECYLLVFEMEFKNMSREGALLKVLQDRDDPWPITFLQRNGCTDKDKNLELLGRYKTDLADIFKETTGPQDWPQVLCQHHREWCHTIPKIRELHLPPAMLEEVVDDLSLDDSLSLSDAIQKQVPKFYRALLGPHAQETAEAQALAAQGLALGYDFTSCYQLAFGLSQEAWLRIALTFMDITPSESEIPQTGITPKALDKFARRLAKEKVDDKALWMMHPQEIGCRFRQANGLYTTQFELSRRQHLKELDDRRKEKRVFVDQLIQVRRDVDKALSKSDHLWHLDGRNPKFHDLLVTQLDKVVQQPIGSVDSKRTFKLSINQLKCDPYLKQMLVDQLVPKDISDDKYNTMRDSLCGLAREFIKDDEDKRKACYHIGRFFRVAIQDPSQFLNDTPAAPDHLMRKRIFLVYERVFEPLLATGMKERAYHELEIIIRNSDTCIDAARRTLMKMEEHPNMYGLTQALTLFERLGHILKNCRLEAIETAAKARAKEVGKNDPVEYDMFMRNAFGLGLSLGVEPCEQAYRQFTNYGDAFVAEDTVIFLNHYMKTMFETVTKAIRYHSKPSGDADPTLIYMNDIVDWAINQSPTYGNTYQPDVDLMEIGQIRPKVVLHMLEDAGYLERVK